MTNKAHYNLYGYENKQNSNFWGIKNPSMTHEGPLHLLKITARYAVNTAGYLLM